MLEELENGQSSGSDPSGSIGNDTGSAGGSGTDGSVRGIDGSGRGIDGNDSGTESSTGTANGFSNGSGDADGNSNASDGNERESSESNGALRASRAERDRSRNPIRLRSFGSGNPATGSATGTTGNRKEGNTSADSESDSWGVNEPIRLGGTGKKQGSPRTVKADESAKGDYKLSDTKDIIRVFVESLFEVPAAALKQDFWKLSKEESKMLCDAIIQWLESMPKSRQSKIAQFINENLPLINLCMVSFYIIADRVKASIAIYEVTKAGRAFDLKPNVANDPVNQQQTVRTPMDSMFNN